jgi:YesN/AraC family two-component response regulator
MTFIERRTFLRIETAKNMLIETDLSIDDIINKIGFSNKSGFYKKFLEATGMMPSDFRKNNKNDGNETKA